MAEKAIRLGGEATTDAIVSAVDALYTEHSFDEKDFTLKHNDDEIAVDSNFAAQSFWKDVRIRFFRKKSAVLGMVLVILIVLLAAVWSGFLDGPLGVMNDVAWALLDLGTGYIDHIALSAYYASLGTVI